MSAGTRTIALEPVVSYPRRAEVGRTYRLTVDLRPNLGAGDWAYEQEEYTIYCELETAPLFRHRAVGEPALVLHRFGGTYGPTSFLLTACDEPASGAIALHLLTAQGLPLASLTLSGIEVRARGGATPQPVGLVDLNDAAGGRQRPIEQQTDAPPPEYAAPPSSAGSLRTLTPLDAIHGFDEALRKKLAEQFWITSAEEFLATIRSSNQQHGSGRRALGVALDIDDARMSELADAVRAALPADTPFSIPADIEVGSGLVMEGLEDVEASSFATVMELPKAVEPLTKAKGIPDPRDQGRRNTSVAFALAAIVQVLSGDPTELSEQFLYYLCKEKDGIRGDVGTSPALAFELLRDVGICTETTWPYQPEPDNNRPGGPTPPPPAYEEARLRRIAGFAQIPARGSAGISQIKAQLAQGKPVLIGLPICEHWTDSAQATALGRLRFPLPGERQSGGQAMCAVGYRDDESAPGGGYFIVRNSWGTEWGRDNPDGPGYCHVPYLLVARQNMVAFVADGLVVQAERPESPALAVLELRLYAAMTKGGQFAADMRLAGADRGAPSELVRQAPVFIDSERLRAMEADPQAYGSALSEQLFADERMRAAWVQVRAYRGAADMPLRLLLTIDASAEELHALRWESLRDPESGRALGRSARVYLSRQVPFSGPATLPEVAIPRALVLAASPNDAARYGLSPIDVEVEVRRVRDALGDIPTIVIGGQGSVGRATMRNFTAALREGPQIVIVIAHSSAREGQQQLWLESEDGATARISGNELAVQLSSMATSPALMVLLNPQGAGRAEPPSTLGSTLVRSGAAAALGLPASMPMSALFPLLATFLHELRRDGQVDRALAAARATLSDDQPWWAPVLYSRLSDGQIWRPVAAPDAPGPRGGLLAFLSPDGGEELFLNGIDVDTGLPLLRIDEASAARMAQSLEPEPAELTNLYKIRRSDARSSHF